MTNQKLKKVNLNAEDQEQLNDKKAVQNCTAFLKLI